MINVCEKLEQNENISVNEINLKTYYFFDINQGEESSKNIYPILLPSYNIIYVKHQIQKRQILIPLNIPVNYIHNNVYLKLWKDSKENLLYNITSIDEPLFTQLIFDENLFKIKIYDEINDSELILNIEDNKILYKIKITDNFFINVNKYIGSLLAYALYILYFKPLLY